MMKMSEVTPMITAYVYVYFPLALSIVTNYTQRACGFILFHRETDVKQIRNVVIKNENNHRLGWKPSLSASPSSLSCSQATMLHISIDCNV